MAKIMNVYHIGTCLIARMKQMGIYRILGIQERDFWK